MRLAGERLERALASPRYRDGKFHNTANAKAELAGPRAPIIRDFLFKRGARRPPGAIAVTDPRAAWQAPVDDLRVTWLGHSSMLLESRGVRVLTDPVFGKRLGPVPVVGPPRFHAPPVSLAELVAARPLDAVLISHDHFDHLCVDTVRAIAAVPDLPIVTSLGVGAYLEKVGVAAARIHELDWWETWQAHADLRFTACPAQHFSGRIGGRNATLWSSWAIETARHKLFFSGDTGLTQEFGDIGARFGRFDLVMLEVGAWHPAWGTIHLGPANALTAFDLLGGGTLMPVHWGTFDLALHAWAQPAEHLVELAAARGTRLVTPRLGIPFEPARIDAIDPWWREVGAPAVQRLTDDIIAAG